MTIGSTYFAIFRKVYFEGLCVVFESERRHGKQDILAIDSLPFFLLALFRSCGSPRAEQADSSVFSCMEASRRTGLPSLVMNEINSLTHSCMHSFASFAILAFSGKAVFMIRATGAKFRISVAAL